MPIYDYQDKKEQLTQSPAPEECCDKWWKTLTDTEKRWVHYYFYNIKLTNNATNTLRTNSILELHESKFILELNKRY